MVKVPCCPRCGHPIIEDEVGAVLTPLQRRIFNLLKRAGTRGMTAAEIIEVVYAHDRNGGPTSRNMVAVVANHMRKRLAQFSLSVQVSRGRYGHYTLQRVPSGRATKAKAVA